MIHPAPSSTSIRFCAAARPVRPPHLRRRVAAAMTGATIGLVAIAGGCAAERSTAPADAPFVSADAQATAPTDFTVDALVMAGRRFPRGATVESRPLRLTLAADASIHAAVAEPIDATTVPDRIRALDRARVAAFWRRAVDLGLTPTGPDAELPSSINPARLDVAEDERVTVVTMTGDGRAWSWVARRRARDEVATGGRDAALDDFVRGLALEAWLPDRPDDVARVVPRRYDLGGDPYRRFTGAEGAGR